MSASWTRTPLTRTAPQRSAGGFYRTVGDEAQSFAGVPLTSANDAVIAAVRLAYKVADAQIDRSTRLAQRLRQAGDRAAGPGSDKQALDAVEQMLFKAVMSGLTWLEGAAAEGGSPLKRLTTAQYRLLGALLGLGQPAEERPAPTESAPQERRTARPAPDVRVVHTGKEKRAVKIAAFEMEGTLEEADLVFYNEDRPASAALRALFLMDRKGATLRIHTSRTSRGRWRAAICDADGVQAGFIEIVI